MLNLKEWKSALSRNSELEKLYRIPQHSFDVLGQHPDLKHNPMTWGAIKINLTTGGRFGAPQEFHIRGFLTKELLALAACEAEDLPEMILHTLDDMILEPSVKVEQFHQKELNELQLILYQSFFSPVLKDQDYHVTEEDKKWMKALADRSPDPSSYGRFLTDLNSGRLKPHYDVMLNNIEYYDSSKVKPTAEITLPQGTKIMFGFPRIGDSLTLSRLENDSYSEDEKRYHKWAEMEKARSAMLEQIAQGVVIPYEMLPTMSDQMMTRLNNFQTAKASFSVDAAKVLMIRSMTLANGHKIDLTAMSLAERFYTVTKIGLPKQILVEVANRFNNLEIGAKNSVIIQNPITLKSQPAEYDFSQLTLYRPMGVQNIMSLLTTLSRHTHNSVAELLEQPYYVTNMIYGELQKQLKDEEKKQKEDEAKARHDSPSASLGSVPSIASMTSAAKAAIPHVSLPH